MSQPRFAEDADFDFERAVAAFEYPDDDPSMEEDLAILLENSDPGFVINEVEERVPGQGCVRMAVRDESDPAMSYTFHVRADSLPDEDRVRMSYARHLNEVMHQPAHSSDVTIDELCFVDPATAEMIAESLEDALQIQPVRRHGLSLR